MEELSPIISSSGKTRIEDMVYCSSLEEGKVNFISHLNNTLEFYEYKNDQLTKIAGQTQLVGFIVDFVDQNSDGKVDLQGDYTLLSNMGNYTFTNSGYPINGNFNVRAKRIVDFNRDGIFDIVSSSVSFSSGTVTINLLDSERKLVDKIAFPETGLIEAVKVVDINNDGLWDIVYTTKKFGDDRLIIQKNIGNNSFSKQDIKLGSTGEELEMGDIDGDTFLDIFITGFSGGDIILYKNENGTFSKEETLVETESIYTIKLNDFDMDGNLDIVYLENLNFDSIGIVVGKGSGTTTFSNFTTIGRVAFEGTSGQSTQAYENWMSIYDYDKDGDMDILVNAILEKKFVAFDNQLIKSFTKEIAEKDGLRIYPNPGTSTINIDDLEKFEYIDIFNINGDYLKNIRLFGNFKIDVDDLSSGVYIFKFYDKKDAVAFRKFIKY